MYTGLLKFPTHFAVLRRRIPNYILKLFRKIKRGVISHLLADLCNTQLCTGQEMAGFCNSHSIHILLWRKTGILFKGPAQMKFGQSDQLSQFIQCYILPVVLIKILF